MAADPLPSVSARFRAMGSDAHVVVVAEPAQATHLLEIAKQRIEHLERRWSRFLPDSDVSRLTLAAGSAVNVAPETALLVQRAIEAWYLTGSLFDPTILGALIRSGYDRSFEQIAEVAHRNACALMTACVDIEIDVDPTGRTPAQVTLPSGTGFDAGGIGKGLAADLVAAELMEHEALGVCVNLGGDLRVEGVSPAAAAWRIAVEHPAHDEPLAIVTLAAGAVATSTTLRRRWTVSDGEHETAAHHLIDPRTALPADTGIDLVAVVTGEAWRAEVLAKACLLRGRGREFDLLDGNAEALAATTAGELLASDGMFRFTDVRHDRARQVARS